MTEAVHVLVVARPTASGEADPLVQAARRLVSGGSVVAVACTGSAVPADIAAALCKLLEGRDGRQLVLLPAGPDGEEIAAFVANRLNGCALGRCSRVALDGEHVRATRPVFGGRCEITLQSDARITTATVRPDALLSLPEPALPATVQVEPLDVAVSPASTAMQTEPLPAPGSQPRVDGARIVVSGGRGIGGPEGFALLERIANALRAGLGGSLPAVDAGWVPVAHQVGQSGKFVSPALYFAVGISGTPQHMAGISPHARIVALNSDPEAPIFAHADVAVEGDWREILPLLVQALES